MQLSISKNRVKVFQERMLAWYNHNGRKFYWRERGLTHYQYIIAEVLLQRTKAETIAKFYPTFLKEFPNWKVLAKTELTKIENFLIPIGLYRQRSKRVLNLAKEMVRRNGRLPKERDKLESIPFIGKYIANAIELVIFNQPSPLVDVNMSRVLERYFGPRKLSDIRYDPYLQNLSKKIVNHKDSKNINWAILDFSALICKPTPLCNECFLKRTCKFYISNYSK